jgi:hypothetical protein
MDFHWSCAPTASSGHRSLSGFIGRRSGFHHAGVPRMPACLPACLPAGGTEAETLVWFPLANVRYMLKCLAKPYQIPVKRETALFFVVPPQILSTVFQV